MGAFVEKNSDTASWHELLHQFGPFCNEFRKSTKWSQMHPNFMKCTKTFVRVQWGGSGAFDAKNSDATSWHKLLHQFGLFCTEFCKSTKWSQMYQNMSLGSNGVERVRSLRKNPTTLRGTNFCTILARFHRVLHSNEIIQNVPKHYEMHQNMSLGSNGVDRLGSLQKIPMRFRGTNFCINFSSSARFAPSFMKQ